MEQPTLFDRSDGSIPLEQIILFALGDFQLRGKVLAERELPLDRLLGAFRRASEFFDSGDLTDGEIVACLSTLGAKIHEVPRFVAKHPYRVLIPQQVADRAKVFYKAKLEESRALRT